jgi:hypothetical protein
MKCYELIGYPEWWDPAKAPRKRNSKPNTHALVAVAEHPLIKTMTSLTTKEESVAGHQLPSTHTKEESGKVFHTSTLSSRNEWIIDSGATDHMTFDKLWLQSFKPSEQYIISSANGTSSSVNGEGSVILTENISLDSVLVVPTLNYNLLSVAQITLALQCIVIFLPNLCVFKDIQTRKTIGYGTRRGKLYYLDLTPASCHQLAQAFSMNKSTANSESAANSEIWLWHKRLGHSSFGYLKKLMLKLFVQLPDTEFKCDVCELAKSHRVPFQNSMNKSPASFMVVHSDVWGPANTCSLNGKRWFISFIDDHTCMIWICLMKCKSEVSSLFKQFHNMVATQYSSAIQVLRSDNGGEFVNQELKQYLINHGIVHQTTCLYTPQQNRVAERKNCQLLEVVRASLFEAHMSTKYWGEAITAATYLINRIPSSTLGFHTPLSVLHKTICSPAVSHLQLRVFGCTAFVHLHKPLRNKLEPRALKCIFVGYAQHQKGYRCYHPPTQKLYVTLDVVFHENIMYYSAPESSSQEHNKGNWQTCYDDLYVTRDKHSRNTSSHTMQDGNSEEYIEAEPQQDTGSEENQIEVLQQETQVPQLPASPLQLCPEFESVTEPQVSSETQLKILPHRTTRGKPKTAYEPLLTSKPHYPMSNFVSYHKLSKENETFMNQISAISIPNSVQEAITDSRWKEAMNEEMRSLQKNCTWKWLNFLQERYRLDAGGCLPLNTKRMAPLKGLKQGL